MPFQKKKKNPHAFLTYDKFNICICEDLAIVSY